MSTSFEEIFEQDEDFGEVQCIRRRTNAGPWRNKKEFEMVHEWIYGPNSDRKTQTQACRQMKIWKLRRLNFTPGTVLSTLLVLDAQLKDAEFTQQGRSDDACAIYSSAFTRFLNYMSAISQMQGMKTMYAAAREFNIDPFLVDLRHMCAHGHTMPSLDVFRKTSAYCLNWLRDFYWDVEKAVMIDVDAKAIRKKDITTFDEKVRNLFVVYDAVSEALVSGCYRVGDSKKLLPADTFRLLKEYAAKKDEEEVDKLAGLLVDSIWNLARQGHRLKDSSQVFIDAFLEMLYFFQEGSETSDESYLKTLVATHQGLFKTIAALGLIEDVYHALVEMAENEMEVMSRRKGAGYWARQIVRSFAAFKQVKMMQKIQKEKKSQKKKSISLSTVNVKVVAQDLLDAYASLGHDVRTIFIFGDSTKCPWRLAFSQNYVKERIEHINEYTIELIRSCFELIEPPLSEEQCANLKKLVDIYAGLEIFNDNNSEDKIYTLQADVLKNRAEDVEMESEDDVRSENTFGIWRRVPDGQEWHSCPLGLSMWE